MRTLLFSQTLQRKPRPFSSMTSLQEKILNLEKMVRNKICCPNAVVGLWDAEDEQTKVSQQIQREMFEKETREQKANERDWWDVEYDKGRMKKVKRNRVDIFAAKENPFQTKKPVKVRLKMR